MSINAPGLSSWIDETLKKWPHLPPLPNSHLSRHKTRWFARFVLNLREPARDEMHVCNMQTLFCMRCKLEALMMDFMLGYAIHLHVLDKGGVQPV